MTRRSCRGLTCEAVLSGTSPLGSAGSGGRAGRRSRLSADARSNASGGPIPEPLKPADHPTVPDARRPPVTRRTLVPDALDEGVGSLPALPRLENDGGAGQSRQEEKRSEGLSLQCPSHLIKTSAGRRQGWGQVTREAPVPR